MHVDLQCSEDIGLVLVILEASQDEAVLIICELGARIVVEDDEGLVDLSGPNDNLLDVFYLGTNNFVHDAFEIRLHIVLLIPEEEDEISILILHMLRIHYHHSVPHPDRIIVLHHQVGSLQRVKRYTLLLYRY